MMIVFGSLGILGGLQEVVMPSMFEMSEEDRQALQQLRENELSDENLASDKVAREILESVEDVFDFPDWLSSWLMISGSVSIVVSLLYLLTGVCLITLKSYAIKLLHAVMAVSIIWAITQAIVALRMDNLLMLGQIPSSVMSTLIDLGLWITVLVCDKTVFKTKQYDQAIETAA